MTARRHATVAVVAALLAVALWWLARDLVVVPSPAADSQHDAGAVTRTVVHPWPLLGAALAAGVAMVATTLALLRRGAARGGLTSH